MSQSLPTLLRLRIITPRKLLLDADVDEVSLPSLEGYLGILPGHRPLVVGLAQGTIAFRLDKNEEKFSVQGGYARILPAEVTVFAELSQDEQERPSEG